MGKAVPSALYRFSASEPLEPSIRVNGAEEPLRMESGFAVIRRRWHPGDRVVLDIPMPVQTVEAHAEVADLQGQLALQRGPLVYCVEWADNPGFDIFDLVLNERPQPRFRFEPFRLGGIGLVEARGTVDREPSGENEVNFRAIPYFAWANRGPGKMTVWLPKPRKH